MGFRRRGIRGGLRDAAMNSLNHLLHTDQELEQDFFIELTM